MDDRFCVRFKQYLDAINSVGILYAMRQNFIDQFLMYESTMPRYDSNWGNILWEARYVPTLKFFCLEYCWDMVEAIDMRIIYLGGVVDYSFRRYMEREYSVYPDDMGFHKDLPL